MLVFASLSDSPEGDKSALSGSQQRGFQLFIGLGRCVSCHTVEDDHALFTDRKFHGIGVGVNAIQDDVRRLAGEFMEAKAKGAEVDHIVLTDKKSSELARSR